ncbi:MAG TPA: CpaF/VirB11 family protein, partial [Actinomycetota bacterium]
APSPYGPEDLLRLGTLEERTLEVLETCVRGRANILISGGAGSGKTTLLGVLSSFIPAGERIVTIEDAAELRLRSAHVVRLEARPASAEGRGAVTVRDLVRNALRMRPDRIVVGEVRGGEALDMLQAMNTGHEGSMSTVHANSPQELMARLETMALMADVVLPADHLREHIAQTVDLVVHMVRLREGRRILARLTSVEGPAGGRPLLRDVFRYAGGGWEAVGSPGGIALRQGRDELDLLGFSPNGTAR